MQFKHLLKRFIISIVIATVCFIIALVLNYILYNTTIHIDNAVNTILHIIMGLSFVVGAGLLTSAGLVFMDTEFRTNIFNVDKDLDDDSTEDEV